jgi:hypothetical protein
MDVGFRRVDICEHASTRRLVDDAFRSKGSEDTAAFLDALRFDGCILGEWLAEDSSGPIVMWSSREYGWSNQMATD